MKTFRIASVTLLLAFAISCGGDDGGGDGDGDGDGDADAAADAASSNALGTLCGPGATCPDAHVCVIPNVPMGSTTEGYCSPMCIGDGQCTTGFAGPGDPVCFRSQCSIVCTDACPTGLACLDTGGPTKVCGVSN